MSSRLFQYQFPFMKYVFNRSFTCRTNFDLGKEMKLLNDTKQFQQAIQLFDEHKTNKDQHFSSLTITQALKACTHLQDIKRGFNIHQLILTRLENDPFILTSLIHFYMQCGDLKNAELLFNKSKKKHLPMFGAMMKVYRQGYLKNNLFDKVFEIFDQIKKPSEVNLIVLFNACAMLKTSETLNIVKKTLNKMPKSYLLNPRLLTSLLDALMKCGDVEHAELLFHQSNLKEITIFGAMMKGYVENNLPNKALQLFHQIKYPNEIILIILFNACASLRTREALDLVKNLSEQIPKSFYSNVRLLSSLLDSLMKCGDVQSAQDLFDRSTVQDRFVFGAMMKGYIENNQTKKAIQLFHQVKHPDDVTMILLFNACAMWKTTESLKLIKDVSEKMDNSFYSNPQVLTSLLNSLMKCGDVQSAQDLFNQSDVKNITMFGAMMQGFVENNMAEKAIELFRQIKDPNEIIMIILFNACASIKTSETLNFIRKVSQEMPKMYYSNVQLVTSLLDALMKCGDVEQAQLLFDQSKIKLVSMYGAMMKGFVENNKAEKAIELFHQIKCPNEIILTILFNACAAVRTPGALKLIRKVSQEMPKVYYSNSQLVTSLLDALMKCGDVEQAQLLFDQSNVKVTHMFGAMMNGFNLENNPIETLKLFNQMKNEGFHRNSIIYLCLIKALSKIGDRSFCESMINEIPDSLLNYVEMRAALISMWGKVGCVDKANEIFNKIIEPNLIDYSAMINSYGLNGMATQAIELYHRIPLNLIGESAHVCVLNACSHAGLVNEARLIYENIKNKTERIYSTMIDCLSRASLFKDAQSLIDEYELSHQPALTMYMALLSGARNSVNADLSKNIYNRMKLLFSEMKDSLVAAGVLLSNAYSSAGEIDKAFDVKHEIFKSNTKKKIGLSWTVVDGQVYEFRAHDQSHPRTNEIYAENNKISEELVEHGHQYDPSWITRPLNQDETIESVLCGHSERLAIAWNFVANPKAAKIQITKNLRVCGECHRATKLIALIRQCEIIVRDANRIHHFYKNGQCSCNDYF